MQAAQRQGNPQTLLEILDDVRRQQRQLLTVSTLQGPLELGRVMKWRCSF